MEKEGIKGNISTVNILIGVLGAKDVDWCFQLLKKWGLQLNSYTCKCVLQAYLRSYDIEKAFDVYKMIRRRGFKLDIIPFNMLLDALAKNNKVM